MEPPVPASIHLFLSQYAKENKQAGSGPARVEKMNLETKKFGDRSKMGLKIF